MPRHKMSQSQFENIPSEELPSVFHDDSLHESKKNLPVEEQNVNDVPDGIFEISTAPKDGTNIVVMVNPEDAGVMAYWRKTRSRKDGKWELSGRWSHTLSHAPIGFEPKYWKDQDSVQWSIDASIVDKQRIIELERQVQELSKR